MLSAAAAARFKALGIDLELLEKAFKEEAEIEVPVPDGTIYTDTSIAELKANVKRGHEEAYPEIFGKKLNEELTLGLSTSDAKDTTKLLAAVAKKAVADAKIEPDKKVTELQESLRKLQEEVIPAKAKEAEEWQGKYKAREEFDRYAAVIPEKANKYLTKEEHVARVRAKVQQGENGIAIDPATGKAYKDNLEKERMFADVVTELYTKNDGWLQPDSGAGVFKTHGVNSPAGNGATKTFNHDKAIEAANASGYAPNDERYMAMITDAMLAASK